MNPVELIRFASDDEVASAVAKDWLELLSRVPADQSRITVALSGGRVAAKLFLQTAVSCNGNPSPFQRVHFFWGDERNVPPDSAESNFSSAFDLLLRPLGIPPAQIHRVPGELPHADAAAAMEHHIRQWWHRPQPQLPEFDLVLLGMGEDGHIASLFPGLDAAGESPSHIYVATTGPKPPPQRISLSYPAIANAREVWVLATGQGKQEALRQSLNNGGTPLAKLLRLRKQTRIYTDIPE